MASGTQWHLCSLLLFQCPVPLSVLFSIQICIKTLQKTTSLSYSKIIWFAFTYCITSDKCFEDHKDRVEIGAHDVRSQTGTAGFAYSREEKTKGDLIAIFPSPKGGIWKFRLFTEKHNEEKRWQSQVARKFQLDMRKKFTMRVVQCKNRFPRESGWSLG